MTTPRPPQAMPSFDSAFEQMRVRLQAFFIARGIQNDSETDVDDLINETQMRAWELRDRLKTSTMTMAWIKRIARNVLNNHLAKVTWRTALMDGMQPGGHQGTNLSSEPMLYRGGVFIASEYSERRDVTSLAQERERAVWTCVTAMPQRNRDLRTSFALHLAGASRLPLAAALDVAPAGLDERLQVAKQELIVLMSRYIVFDEDGEAALKPWLSRAQVEAMETAWDWIGLLHEELNAPGKLALLGGVERGLLKRLGFRHDLDWEQLSALRARMQAAGWN